MNVRTTRIVYCTHKKTRKNRKSTEISPKTDVILRLINRTEEPLAIDATGCYICWLVPLFCTVCRNKDELTNCRKQNETKEMNYAQCNYSAHSNYGPEMVVVSSREGSRWLQSTLATSIMRRIWVLNEHGASGHQIQLVF